MLHIKIANYIILEQNDNVAVALKDMDVGDVIKLTCGTTVIVQDKIMAGHKFAIRKIISGENLIKYGHPIGHAVCDINIGQWVHTHNIKTNLEGIIDYSYDLTNNLSSSVLNESIVCTNSLQDNSNKLNFMGYVRKDGRVGTRNEVWIINTVGCVNKTAEILARESNKIFSAKIGAIFDGVYAFPHPYGCSQLGEDHITTQRILSALVKHPNAAGVLVLGLGCENNNINEFKKVLSRDNPIDEKRIRFLSTQDCQDEINIGLEYISQLIDHAATFKHQKCPLSDLKIGLKCGGSDAFSGITANPLCGKVSDILAKHKGTTILTEVPEMFGAETILMEKCINEEVFNKTVNMINEFKDYFLKHNQIIYENPSPGNKEGGISTLEEKSLGCILKGGSSAVVDVLKYGDRVVKKGLNLLEGPGNDAVSTTALTAAGANLIIFTTGRGTPFGAPVPTIKMSTTTGLFRRKEAWIDYDAGQLIDGANINSLAEILLEFIISVASNQIKTKNEVKGYKEIAIFKNGITL